MKKVSLESEINAIIKKSVVVDSYEHFVTKGCSSRKCSYEYDLRMEEELRKRARNMFRKKPERFPVPKVQKVLAVFSNHRGKVNEIVKAVDKCTYGKTLLRIDVLKTYLSRIDLKPITDLGVSWEDAKTLFLNARDIPYALTIMPKAYLN